MRCHLISIYDDICKFYGADARYTMTRRVLRPDQVQVLNVLLAGDCLRLSPFHKRKTTKPDSFMNFSQLQIFAYYRWPRKFHKRNQTPYWIAERRWLKMLGRHKGIMKLGNLCLDIRKHQTWSAWWGGTHGNGESSNQKAHLEGLSDDHFGSHMDRSRLTLIHVSCWTIFTLT